MTVETHSKSSHIAVIDSGVGGITVLKSLVDLLPKENFLYLGDTLNNPYGDKTNDEIRNLTFKMLDFLKTQNVKALVIACNTINSFMYSEILKVFGNIVIGVIFPTVDHVNSIGVSKVGVIATHTTIKNGSYQKMLEKDVYPLETPNFVKIVESQKYKEESVVDEVKQTLKPLLEANVEALVLGCTHYPFLKDAIEKNYDGLIIESGFVTALDLKDRLAHNNLLNDETGSVNILVTKDLENFEDIIKGYVDFEYRLDKVEL